MIYAFQDSTRLQLQQAFSSAQLFLEKKRNHDSKNWEYYFLEFDQPIELFIDEYKHNSQSLVNIITHGTDFLNKQFKKYFGEKTNIKLGFRWQGAADKPECIQLQGYALILRYYRSRPSPFNVNKLLALLIDIQLLDPRTERVNFLNCKIKAPRETNSYVEPNTPRFFKQSPLPLRLIDKIPQRINERVNVIKPLYTRTDEWGINPVYSTLEDHQKPLCINRKYIWLFRSDGIIATGVKNAYWIYFGENTLDSAIPEESFSYLNWGERAGHPSLAIKAVLKDKIKFHKAFYGGYFCQKEDYLHVFTSSGRFYRHDLNIEQKILLEAYVAFRLQQQFGEQKIVFYEGPYADFYELSFFYADKPLPQSVITREYTTDKIQQILTEQQKEQKKLEQKRIEQQRFEQLKIKAKNIFDNYTDALRDGDDEEIAAYWKEPRKTLLLSC